MKRTLALLATLLFAGSSGFAAAESTSLYLASARKAEHDKNHREAIYCLSMVLLEIFEHTPSKGGLNKEQITEELIKELREGGREAEAAHLKVLTGKELKDFLSKQISSSNPGKTIDVYSDGTLSVHSCKWNSPLPSRFSFVETPEVYRPNTAAYNKVLSLYWWFKLPTTEQLAKLPKYVETPKNSAIQDGAFKHQ